MAYCRPLKPVWVRCGFESFYSLCAEGGESTCLAYEPEIQRSAFRTSLLADSAGGIHQTESGACGQMRARNPAYPKKASCEKQEALKGIR